jgi:arachidonate 15-lipoxygenase
MTESVQTLSLPQDVSDAEREQREFQLSLARTSYNYSRSYLEPVPLSADLPKGEEFSIEYEAKVLKAFVLIAENFKKVVMGLLKKELEGDLPTDAMAKIGASYDKLMAEMSILHPIRDAENLKALIESLAQLPKALQGLLDIPKDLEKMAVGLETVFGDFIKNGPTAFLKSTLYDMLSETHGRNYLQATSVHDFRDLFIDLPPPLTLALPTASWMPADSLPCEQDWFFGYLQIAGYNTTNLRGVVLERGPNKHAVTLADLQAKMPITDAILQKVIADSSLTLHQAITQQRLYVCDYTGLVGAKSDKLNGEQRYLAAPIALFYWNPTPPPGYPPIGASGVAGSGQPGVMQPVAIQLAQEFDAEAAPIFTPNDCAQANDPSLYKWKIAKYIVNVICAIQHESVAHLGECHMTVEPMVVASHRQLAEQHPLLKLLTPHFRFTININDSALHSLIIPGGVVATTVCPAIESTLQMVAAAHEAWRWDDNCPNNVFELRGVEKLPSFPFRDDTLLIWSAIKKFVGGYLRVYYADDAAVANDQELQAWVHELTSPLYAGLKGLRGLSATGNPNRPWRLDSLDYLIEMVAHIIYIAGPQHAAVNYAQYPLMTYMPSVSGAIYSAPPTTSLSLASSEDCLAWYPPLDVSLYTLSFEYLLSAIQFDTFGHYDTDPRRPYFTDPRVGDLVADFKDELALIEIEVRQRNRLRPMPYEFQLPSRIPNSISV